MTFEELTTANRATMIDSLVKCGDTAATISAITERSYAFGEQEAGRSKTFFARAEYDNFDDLNREGVRLTERSIAFFGFNHHFVLDITTMAAAMGFQKAHHRKKYAAVYDLIEKLENQVTVESTDDFFNEMIRLYRNGDATQVVDFTCMAMHEKNIKFPTTASFRLFANMAMGEIKRP